MDKDKLNKKLAEFAQLRVSAYYPNQFYYKTWRKKLPDFPNDLNSCFKWLVPKLAVVNLTTLYLSGFWACVTGEHGTFDTTADTPALALCLAIEKLIDDETVS